MNMEEMIPCSIKDQEVFRRVWQRVMEGRDGAQCPLEAMPSDMQGDLSCDCLEALLRGQGPGVPEECGRQSGEETPVPDVPVQEQPAPVPPLEEGPVPEVPAEGGSAPEPSAEEQLVLELSAEEQPVSELSTEDGSAPEPPAEEQPAPENAQPPAQVEAASEALAEADGPHRDNDLPRLWEAPQEATDDRTARLRRQVMEALEGWQFYRHLARKARAGDARVLNSMAGELHRQARKLSAAYFLLTGLRYWPSELLSTPAIPSYWGALRTRHQAEQRQEMAYRMAADDWDDPDMQEMYTELIEACQHRNRQLRGLLEQDIS